MSESWPTDTDLIDAVLARTPGAFAELVRRHRRLVLSIASSHLTGEADIQDVVQETFLQVHRKLPGFRGEAKLSTWIGQVAFSRTMNHARSLGRRQARETGWPHTTYEDDPAPQPMDVPAPEPTPLQAMAAEERHRILNAAMAQLPPQQRLLLRLAHQEDWSIEALAELTGRKAGTVKSDLFRARKRLKAAFLAFYETEDP